MAGIPVFWLAVVAAMTGAISVLAVLTHALHLGPLSGLTHLFERGAVLWPAVSWVAFATVALYVTVGAATLPVDHCRSTAG